jgi:nucleolar MIF4G domain-containing protein 1
VLVPLVSSFAATISALNTLVGNEVGAFCLEQYATKMHRLTHPDELNPDTGEPWGGGGGGGGAPEAGGAHGGSSKEAANVMLLIVYLYNFGVVKCELVYDIVRVLVNRFNAQDVDLLLLLLQHGGFQLRADDPTALKDIIVLVQNKAAEQQEAAESSASRRGPGEREDLLDEGGGGGNGGRVSFVLDMIYDLKNNRKRSAQEQTIERTVRLRKLVGHARKGRERPGDCLHVSWQNLLSAEKTGRWWIAGAPWQAGKGPGEQDNDDSSGNNGGKIGVRGDTLARVSKGGKSGDQAAEILKLAAKQRMNTDVRRRCLLYSLVLLTRSTHSFYSLVLLTRSAVVWLL